MKNFRFLSLMLFAFAMTFLLIPLFGIIPSSCLGAGIICLYWLPGESGALGMNNTNNFSARDSYRIAKELIYNAMRNDPKFGDITGNPKGDRDCRDWVNSRKFSQSEIRLEVELNAVNSSFMFALTATQQNSTNVIFNTENRLTIQDTLICNEYALFIGNPTSRVDTTWELKTYGNPITFAAGTDANLLNTTLYNHGYFKMTCNKDVIIPYRGLLNHWYRPQTQQTAVFGAGSPNDQIRGAEDGGITQEPNLLLIGSKGYEPQIILPSNMALTDTFIRAILIFRGDFAQNSTSVA